MDKIVIGKVIKPQGIKGEIKVDILPQDKALASKLKEIYLDNKCYKVVSVKNLVNGMFFKLEGVDDRNQAELLRGMQVAFERDKMPKLEQGRYLVSDIIGMEVIVCDSVVGTVADILQYGAADVYVVKGDKNFMFPCLKTVLAKVDVENKKLYLNKEILEQIAVYEDWSVDIVSEYVCMLKWKRYRQSVGKWKIYFKCYGYTWV